MLGPALTPLSMLSQEFEVTLYCYLIALPRETVHPSISLLKNPSKNYRTICAQEPTINPSLVVHTQLTPAIYSLTGLCLGVHFLYHGN